ASPDTSSLFPTYNPRVTNPDHDDDQAAVVDLVNDPVRSCSADAIAVDSSSEFLAAGRPRIISERVDDGDEPRAGGSGEEAKCACRACLDLDRVPPTPRRDHAAPPPMGSTP